MKRLMMLLSILIAAPLAFGQVLPSDKELQFEGVWKKIEKGEVVHGTWTGKTTFERKVNDDGAVVTMTEKVSIFHSGELQEEVKDVLVFKYGKDKTFTVEGEDDLKGKGICQESLDGWQCGYRFTDNDGRGGESFFFNKKIIKRRGFYAGVYWRGSAKIAVDKVSGDCDDDDCDDHGDCGCDVDDGDKKSCDCGNDDCGCDLDHGDCGCDVDDGDKKSCDCGNDDCGCDVDHGDHGDCGCDLDHDDCGCDVDHSDHGDCGCDIDDGDHGDHDDCGCDLDDDEK